MRILALFFVLMAGAAHAMPGVDVYHERHLTHDGVERLYYLHIPDGLPEGAPLIVALHGLGGRAAKLRYGTELNTLAAEHGFAVAYPQGEDFRPTSSHWNAGFDFSEVDDTGFLAALVTELQDDLGLGHAYGFGISNGGYMAYHMACASPDTFDAIAVISATMSGGDWRACDPDHPTPLLHVHGRDDPMIKWEGQSHWMSGWGQTPPIPEIVSSWVARHGAHLTQARMELPKTRLYRYADDAGKEVVWFAPIRDYGHDLPNMGNAGFSAVRLAWSFFETFEGTVK